MSSTNPYPDDGKHEMFRLAGDVYGHDYHLIKNLTFRRGYVQLTVNTLWKKLCDELRKRGITDYTRSVDFVDFLERCELILPEERGTTTQPPTPKADVSNVGRGTPGASAENPATPNVAHDVPSGPRRKGRGNTKTRDGQTQ